MRSTISRIALILSVAAAAVGAASATPVRDVLLREAPVRYVNPQLDGPAAIVQNPIDGRVWSAWAYRSGSEFDIALSVSDAAGTWSRPVFIGRFDGVDQTDPALATDASGNMYLAYSAQGRVYLSTLSRGASAWSVPFALSPPDTRAAAPALRVVADRLVIAWRTSAGIELADLPLSGTIRDRGIQDGPDPIGGGAAPTTPSDPSAPADNTSGGVR